MTMPACDSGTLSTYGNTSTESSAREPPSRRRASRSSIASRTSIAETLCSISSSHDDLSERQISKIISALRQVEVRDRRHHLITYKQCFVGAEAVDALLLSGLARNREDAVKLGRKIAAERMLFEHVSGKHEFEDKALFYRFSELVGKTIRLEIGGPTKAVHDRRSNDHDRKSNAHDRKAIARTAKALLSVEVKDRKRHMKTHSLCFIGGEAIDLLMARGCASSRKEAVKAGRRANRQFNLFQSVGGEKELEDDSSLYRFSETHESGRKLLQKANSELLQKANSARSA